MINYEPFWQTARAKNISQYKLRNEGIDNHTLFRLRHNQNLTIKTIEKLCKIVGGTPNDIFMFTEESGNGKSSRK